MHKDIIAFTLLKLLDFGCGTDVTPISQVHVSAVFFISKCNVHPRTGHKGPEGE